MLKKLKLGEVLEKFIPSTLVPFSALAALLFEALARYRSPTNLHSLARVILQTVVSIGMVPSLVETAEEGWEAVVSGEADVPALIAMQLGLCLNQIRATTVILVMLTGGEAFEERALQRAGESLHSLLKQRSGLAHKIDASENVCKVAVESLREGDVVLVKSGERVPVDGALKKDEGSSRSSLVFDEALLTGENIPTTKKVGDHVLAGSVCRGAPCRVEASKPYESSAFALMQGKLEEALKNKADIELKSKKFVAAFTPFTFLLAAAACIFADSRGKSAREMWEAVLSVFMSATPCPAGIGVPIALLSGLSVASSRYGATVKSGTALEQLAVVSTIVLDKTGTITLGKPSVKSFQIEKGNVPAIRESVDILRVIASVEKLSVHPLASAVCKYFEEAALAERRNTDYLSVKELKESDGQGIAAAVVFGACKFEVKIGGRKLCFDESENESNSEDIEAFFLISDQKSGSSVRGHFTFVDKLRRDAPSIVRRLQSNGFKVIILSGDRSKNLEIVAADVGVTDFYACWPHEKAAFIECLRAKGEIVLMVGDGTNDAAALAISDVGISIGTESFASESASIVLLKKNLANIEGLLEMSRRVVSIAKETVLIGMTLSLVQMSIAAAGLSSPFMSSVVQEAIDLGAVLYSLRALQQPSPHLQY